MIEATGLGGATLPLVLLPGLLAAGIGSLVFIGLGSWSGFSTAAWSLSPFPLPAYGGPGWGDFGWTIVLAVAAAVVVFVVMELARWASAWSTTRPFVLTIVAGLAVGGLAIAFAEATDDAAERGALLGRDARSARCSPPRRRSRSRRWRCCSSSRASPGASRSATSAAARRSGASSSASSPGCMAAHLPGYAETPAVAALVGRRVRLRPAPAARLGDDREPPLGQGRPRRRAARSSSPSSSRTS